MSAAPLRLVSPSPRRLQAPKRRKRAVRRGTSTERLQRAIAQLEQRYARRGRYRYGTRAMARAALVEVGNVIALIALHLPFDTARQRAYQRETIDPILEAIDRATGHCPVCSVRVASWAAPTGPLACYPCPSHKTAAAAGGAL